MSSPAGQPVSDERQREERQNEMASRAEKGNWLAGEEELTAVLILEKGLKGVRHLESALVVDASRRVAPKHAQLLHFWPQNSTRIVEEGPVVVNRKYLTRQ